MMSKENINYIITYIRSDIFVETVDEPIMFNIMQEQSKTQLQN